LRKVTKKKQNEDSEPISTTEAAERLGISRKRVNQLIDEQKLPAKKIGKVWIIDPKDLALVENRQKTAGRPKKSTTTPTTPEDEEE
jgi:excisionase family DNA binding protein